MSRKILFVMLLFLLPTASACPRINEVMPNPIDSCSDCTEWVEIYNNCNPMSIDNFTLDAGGKNITLSGIIEDYIIVTKNKTTFLQIWPVNQNKILSGTTSLNNEGDRVILYDSDNKMLSSIIYPSFSSKENQTYALVNDVWSISQSPTPLFQNINPQESQPTEIGGDIDEPVFEQVSKPSGKIGYEIQAPYRIESGREFITRVLVQNKYSTKKEFTVYSYVYRGSKCYSCIKSREENAQSIILEAKSSSAIYLRNTVQSAEDGNYSFRVSILPEGFDTTKNLYFPLEMRNKEASANNESVLNSSAQSNQIEKGNAPITGEVVYKSKGLSSRDKAYWLFLILCISLLVYLITRKEGKNAVRGEKTQGSIHNRSDGEAARAHSEGTGGLGSETGS